MKITIDDTSNITINTFTKADFYGNSMDHFNYRMDNVFGPYLIPISENFLIVIYF